MLENEQAEWFLFFQDNIPPSSFLLLTSTSLYCLPIFDSLSMHWHKYPSKEGAIDVKILGNEETFGVFINTG